MRPQGLIPIMLGPVNGLEGSGIQSPALLSFCYLLLLPILSSLQNGSYLKRMYQRTPGLMELELRKWLRTSFPKKIVYPFPKHSQGEVWCVCLCVCVCVCKSEMSQDFPQELT